MIQLMKTVTQQSCVAVHSVTARSGDRSTMFGSDIKLTKKYSFSHFRHLIVYSTDKTLLLCFK